jgi:thiamine monophosphate synthase
MEDSFPYFETALALPHHRLLLLRGAAGPNCGHRAVCGRADRGGGNTDPAARQIAAMSATAIFELCAGAASDADGIHLGQDDLSPTAARKIFDQVKDGKHRIIGFSTHNLSQVLAADTLPIDYIAIGPVFATGSKANPDPVVGLEGVRRARRVTKKPLVAIGGITRQNCSQVKDSGADAVAVISDLLESPGKAVADFLRVLG